MQRFLAKSKAGHDKNHVYVVLKTEGDMAYLVNGKTKKVEKPKLKKLMHIQPIKHLPEEVVSILSQSALADQDIINILDIYDRRKLNV